MLIGNRFLTVFPTNQYVTKTGNRFNIIIPTIFPTTSYVTHSENRFDTIFSTTQNVTKIEIDFMLFSLPHIMLLKFKTHMQLFRSDSLTVVKLYLRSL